MSFYRPRSAEDTSLGALDAADKGALARLLSMVLEPKGAGRGAFGTPDHRAELAKQMYDHRRRRDHYLPAELFGEPTWDILLILYWAQATQQRISISGVCDGAAVPPTTALRYIEHLSKQGFINKESHPTDGRVSWLSLSDMAEERMDQYFGRILRASANPQNAPAVSAH